MSQKEDSPLKTQEEERRHNKENLTTGPFLSNELEKALSGKSSIADELLRHLTTKFNRLLDTLKQEESERIRLELQV